METLEKSEIIKKGVVHFYTVGDGFTSLLRNLIREGEFSRVYDVLSDGGLPENVIKEFFLFNLKLEGDTRVKPDLWLEADEQPKDYGQMLYYAVKMAEKHNNDKEREYDYLDEDINVFRLQKKRKESKDIDVLFNIFTPEELAEIIFDYALQVSGWKIGDVNDNKEDLRNGVILRDGKYITCGYQEHIDLYPFLVGLYKVDSSNWSDDTWGVHVSSGSISGNVVYSLGSDFRKCLATDQQIDTLFKFKKSIHGVYGGYKTTPITETIRRHIGIITNHGGKFNNLTFLQRFYPEINLPKFSKEPLMEGKQCIRTSPKYSLAGLLNSKFDINENSINEIKADWEKYKNVRERNELFYFYQEYLEGDNGVCHYWKEEKNFTYSISKNRGDIVQGVKSNDTISSKHKQALVDISEKLSTDLGESVQLEFVINNNKVYIVQLRLLENNHERFETDPTRLTGIIGVGQTFSRGRETVNVADILIVDSDADSDALLGKKALIVRENTEFSHILALSKALKIPSMFAMESLNLEGVNEVEFIAEGLTSYISKKQQS